MTVSRGPVPVSIGPEPMPWIVDAVIEAGGVLVPPDAAPEALLWTSVAKPDALRALLDARPEVSWVQFHSSGIEAYAELLAGIADRPIAWTSAKGAYAMPVAEHALALLLAAGRGLAERARAVAWGSPAGRTLYGARVVIVGAGGIAREIVRLLAPFGAETVVVRRSAEPLSGASRTVPESALPEALATADAVVLAAALTPGTRGMIGARELERMPAHAVLINVGRGGLVDTAALVAALERGAIAGAALDVTDPEPLPAGHALWRAPNALVTPHTANTPELMRPHLLERVAANVRAFVAGRPLAGVVDPRLGY